MDEVKDRLKNTSEECLKTYETWTDDKKNGKNREALQEAVHELRKVASRIEIELAVSERDEMSQKPIPIPPHRDANRRPDPDDDLGNGNQGKSPGRRSSGGARRPYKRRNSKSS